MALLSYAMCLVCSLIINYIEMSSSTDLERSVQKSSYRRPSGQCGDPLNVQCCLGSEGCSVGGCYCDESCVQSGDCCDDYIETCQSGPCYIHSVIDDQGKRSSDYVTDLSNDIFISDEHLTAGWYTINSLNGAEMASHPPGYLHCGTQNPVWLNGTLPSVEDGIVTKEGCVQTSNDICEESLAIGIVNCSKGFYVYQLQNTSRNSAYCFGNGPVLCYDSLSSVSGYYPGCSSLPEETLAPVVQAILAEGTIQNITTPNTGPSLHSVFRCYFDDVSNNSFLYDVIWYINGNNVNVFRNILFDYINSTFLYDTHWIDKYQMNMEVSCSVRLRYGTNSIPSPYFTSSVFRAGVYPDKYEYTVIEGRSIDIIFHSTVPVACIASNLNISSTRTCELDFHISKTKYDNRNLQHVTCVNNVVNRDIVFETDSCRLTFNSLTWFNFKKLTVHSFVDGLYNSQDRSTFIKLTAISSSEFTDMWTGIQIPDIKVTVIDKDSVLRNRVCQSYNDPHMTTFDGRNYENQEVGEYVLYRNDKGPYWVHALYTNCGYRPGSPTCNCGIAIRSHSSLFIFRTCAKISSAYRYMLPSPQIENINCNDSNLHIEHHGKSYSVTLPIGTAIKFGVDYRGLISQFP